MILGDADGAAHALAKAFKTAKPEVLNSDQGSQFTGRDYIEYVEKNAVNISMDGKSRWADNIMIERWFCTLKYDEIHLKDYENIRDARRQIGISSTGITSKSCIWPLGTKLLGKIIIPP